MKTMRKFFSFILNIRIAFAFFSLIPFTTTAQFSSLTNETLVNTSTAGDQYGYWWSVRTVAVQPDGGYIVVWIDVNGLDGSQEGIFGQRFNASGAKVGSQFQVNTTTSGQQYSPAIAVAPDGSFIVAWEGPGSSIDVFAQRFTKDAVKVEGEFLLNTTLNGSQRYPEMQYFSDGTLVAGFVDGAQTVLQKFDASARTIGLETRISSGTGDVVIDGLTVRPDNSIILTWTSGADVYAQLFDNNLQALGTAKRINTYTTGTQEYALARSDGDGNFVIVWESDGQDGSGMGIYGRRYDKNFNPLSGEFAITTNTTNNQFEPQVAVEPGGRFIITWSDNNNRDGGGGTNESVWMREFAANGTAVGVETRVNQSITGYQAYPVIDINASGRFVISWEGNGTQAGQIDSYGLFARAYQFSQTGTTSVTVSPASAIAGDIVTVTMTLTAPSSITNVTPNLLSPFGTNEVFATLVSGPSPASATVGTSPVNFTWTYRVTANEAAGVLSFGGNAHSDGVAIFPFAQSTNVSVSPSIYLTDLTAPNLVNDANDPNSGPKVFTIGTRITNGGLTTLTNTNIYLGNGVTAGVFPVTTMVLAQTNNTYQGNFALTPLAGVSDCTRPIGTLGAAKKLINGSVDFNADGVVNSSDDGVLSNGKTVIDGRIDVNSSGSITATDDYTRPPGTFTGYREPAIIDGYVDWNNDGTINASDNGTYGGGTTIVYWQVRYAVVDASGQPTFGDCGDFGDDLRYKWNVWATGHDGTANRNDLINEFAKVRCELSAAANKIVPNPGGFISSGTPRIIGGMVDLNQSGTITTADDGVFYGKTVIDGKLDMNNSGTITTADDGTINIHFPVRDGFIDYNNDGVINASDDGIIVLPGETVSITFNNATFGLVVGGFDENRDNAFDYDMWHQPVGSTDWWAASFRLINIESYVTGLGGSNPLDGITTYYNNEPYLSRLIGDVGGTFNITYTYTFQVMNHINSYLTPYQEAASGTNNEKYNNDFPTVGIRIASIPNLVLPVTGLTATAKLNQSISTVQWKTETELNSDYFVVERSIDGLTYLPIYTNKASVNSTSDRNYSYNDNVSSIQQQTIYYRIKQVDTDGKMYYSNVTSVKTKKQVAVEVWPNPFVSSVFVTINSSVNEKATMSLYDVQGKLINTNTSMLMAGINKIELNSLDHLPMGIYNLRIVSKDGVTNFMLKK
jgi:hypothetical protein